MTVMTVSASAGARERHRQARAVGQEVEVHAEASVERAAQPDGLRSGLDDVDAHVRDLELGELAARTRRCP